MKKKAVFLDRDGVINRETGKYTTCLSDFYINQGVGEAVKLLTDNGFLVIVISNQGGIARNLYSFNDVEAMHSELMEYLKKHGTAIDEFYFCPHHESTGMCLCRKPKPLLIEKAIARFDIDAGRSFFIGDTQRDMEAAEAAGVNGILIEANAELLPVCRRITSNHITSNES